MTAAAMQMAEKQSMRASIVSGCDTSPILEFSEHALDLVALFVERLALKVLGFSALAWRDAGVDAL